MTWWQIYLVAHGTCAGFITGRVTAYGGRLDKDDWVTLCIHPLIAPLSVAVACVAICAGWWHDRRVRKRRKTARA